MVFFLGWYLGGTPEIPSLVSLFRVFTVGIIKSHLGDVFGQFLWILMVLVDQLDPLGKLSPRK